MSGTDALLSGPFYNGTGHDYSWAISKKYLTMSVYPRNKYTVKSMLPESI